VGLTTALRGQRKSTRHLILSGRKNSVVKWCLYDDGIHVGWGRSIYMRKTAYKSASRESKGISNEFWGKNTKKTRKRRNNKEGKGFTK